MLLLDGNGSIESHPIHTHTIKKSMLLEGEHYRALYHGHAMCTLLCHCILPLSAQTVRPTTFLPSSFNRSVSVVRLQLSAVSLGEELYHIHSFQ